MIQKAFKHTNNNILKITQYSDYLQSNKDNH